MRSSRDPCLWNPCLDRIRAPTVMSVPRNFPAPFLLVLLTFFGFSFDAESKDCAETFKELEMVSRNSEVSEAKKSTQISLAYRRLYSNDDQGQDQGSLSGIGGDCLRLRYRAATLTNFYTFDPSHLDDMKRLVDRLEAAGLAKDSERADMFHALIGHRRFDEARNYLIVHPRLAVGRSVPVVEFIDSSVLSGPTAFVVRDDETLEPIRYDLGSGRHLVVVAHPLCSFSRKAMEDLAVDEDFARFPGRTIWLAPVDQRLSLDAFRAWNNARAASQVVIARHQTDWPFIDDWSTPVFYLIDEGMLVGKLVGWPRGGSKDALMKLLSTSHSP